jgi:hypothetical protein
VEAQKYWAKAELENFYAVPEGMTIFLQLLKFLPNPKTG